MLTIQPFYKGMKQYPGLDPAHRVLPVVGIGDQLLGQHDMSIKVSPGEAVPQELRNEVHTSYQTVLSHFLLLSISALQHLLAGRLDAPAARLKNGGPQFFKDKEVREPSEKVVDFFIHLVVGDQSSKLAVAAKEAS